MTQTRTVTCARCGETTTGLSRPPLWDEWFEQSINVINHYGLNPALREHREQLYEVMREFLNLTGK
jgi:Fe-S cluster biosynthesis and repair protein YggX